VLVFALSLLAVSARADLTQRPGWPVTMSPGISGQYLLAPIEGVAFANLVGDSRLEVIASSGDRVFVWTLDGLPVAGWPQTLKGTGQAPPSVGDLDGDGDLEIVQVARGLKYSDTTYLHAFHADGAAVEGWPVSFPNLIFNTVALGDLDGNGGLDLLVQVGRWPPAGSVTVLAGDGRTLGKGWAPQELGGLPVGPAAVADLDGDGQLEVVHLSQENLTARLASGSLAAGFPIPVEAGRAFSAGVAVADLSPQSPGLELAAPEISTSASGAVRLQVFTAAGKPVAGFPVTLAADAAAVGIPSIGDLDGDGKLEIVLIVRGAGIVVVSADGKVNPPIPTLADATASVQLLDLDGDGKLELLADNNTADTDGKGYLEAYRADGTPLVGFPLRPPGSTMSNGGMAADLDGDGVLELCTVSTDSGKSPPVSYVNLWGVPGSKARTADWPLYARDPRRSGCQGVCAPKSSTAWKADAGVPPDATAPDLSILRDAGAREAAAGEPAAPTGGDGCGCRVGAGPEASWGALAALLALATWLRRRGRRS
jgi:MYXO-CTERM domain-containing protein